MRTKPIRWPVMDIIDLVQALGSRAKTEQGAVAFMGRWFFGAAREHRGIEFALATSVALAKGGALELSVWPRGSVTMHFPFPVSRFHERLTQLLKET